MTGIERLRGFARRMDELNVWPGGAKLLSIADQIERERAEELMGEHRAAQKYQSRCVALENAVRAAICAMERHVSGVEGMEDSPVARWARELREALVGTTMSRHESDAVAGSPRDSLADEDRGAAAWVREHGGLSHVKDILHDFRAVVERIGVEWSESELHGLMDALDRRLMPESMEWPRYENGEPIVPGETRFGASDGKEWTIDAVGRGFAWSGLSRTAQAKGKRPTRLRPEWLTKERPDSWERLEEDVASASCPDVYCANHHIDASDTSYEWAMARDIVRRARALAERDA